MGWAGDAVRWYVVLALITWAIAPLVRMVFPRLPDRGATVARPIALLVAIYPTWLLASVSVISVSEWAFWISIICLAAVGWGISIRRRLIARSWIAALGVAEVVSCIGYAAYTIFRGFAPWILNTEKPMDIALLSASARATTIPPLDPWYAGEHINYYYLGYFLYGSVSRLAHIPTSVGFNLAIATIFSMTVAAAGGLAFNIVRSWRARGPAVAAGLTAILLIVFSSNLKTITWLIPHFRTTIDAWWWSGIGWWASRIVVDTNAPGVKETINEFPAFSFVLGDLHPHVMAMPFVLVALTIAFSLLMDIGPELEHRLEWRQTALLASLGGIIGALYAINSWDYPTFLAIAVLSLAVATRALSSRTRLLYLAILSGSSLIAWLPFYWKFTPPIGVNAPDLPIGLDKVPVLHTLLTTFGVVDWDRTSSREFLTVFGVPYVCSLLVLGVLWHPGEWRTLPYQSFLAICITLVTLVALLSNTPVLFFCGIPLLAIGWLLRQHHHELSLRTIATALFGVGLLLIVGTEFFYLRDEFSNRMNTLFKIYFQVWMLFGIAMALGISELWRRFTRQRPGQVVVTVGVAAALIAVLPYSVISAYQYTKSYGPSEWHGLDGMAYLAETSPDDLAAIEWLRDNATEHDVILESQSCAYQPWGEIPTARVSAFTGIPTLMGWTNHEDQWRNGQESLIGQISVRSDQIAEIYADPQSPLVEHYGITLMFIGTYELEGAGRACEVAGPYPETRADNYPGSGWTLVFERGTTRIYRRAA